MQLRHLSAEIWSQIGRFIGGVGGALRPIVFDLCDRLSGRAATEVIRPTDASQHAIVRQILPQERFLMSHN